MYLQQRTEVWSIDFDGVHTYGEIYRQQEIEHCIYNFELADVERQRTLCDLYNAEAEACIERGLVAPAHDYVLRQSQALTSWTHEELSALPNVPNSLPQCAARHAASPNCTWNSGCTRNIRGLRTAKSTERTKENQTGEKTSQLFRYPSLNLYSLNW
ncbi:Glycine--tRNA ligase alpha subunit [Geodia barretti]|uniref:glycine--tRNA ligase n=1 Tax=Geodia barretti TaxID=519541 RepID=A0AA35SAB9_GEOBA|nr:Glycine--tRNA ligase alpha subunit [Geodia barretti]